MPAPYPTPRLKSATPGATSLRARIAATLGELIADHGTRHIGEVIGAANSTVHRRADDIAQWPASDLLALAVAFPSLGADVVAYIQGDTQPTADSTDAERLAFRGNAEDAAAIIERGAALVDGRWDANEARRRVARIDEEIAHRIEEKAALMARMGRQP